MKLLLELAVSNVHFKCKESWYCLKDRFAMGASLEVILAYHWMTPKRKTKAQLSSCRNCEHRVITSSKGVECEICNRWFDPKIQESVTPNRRAWKTGSGCPHFAVKMI